MPNQEITSATASSEQGAGIIKPYYSPRLCNDDLAPTRDQNWSWYNIFLSGCPTYTVWAAMWSQRVSSRSG